MKIILGSDEKTFLTDHLFSHLTQLGHQVILAPGPLKGETLTWPNVGFAVGRAVAQREADTGIVLCFTGTGVTIAANKVVGVRAALCTDAKQAEGARRWNDANVLALSLRLTTPILADEILAAWLGTKADAEELKSIALIASFEKART